MFKVGKKYVCRGLKDAYVEIISFNDCSFEKEEYPLVGILNQRDKATVRMVFTKDGKYVKNTESVFDLLEELSSGNFLCKHEWQNELLFNVFHEYCFICGVRR